MSLKMRIQDDMKSAMKAQDKTRVSVLRMLMSELKYAQAAVNLREELAETEVEKVVTSYYKKLDKSLGDFPEGDARDAVKAEMKVVAEYMPQKASSGDVTKAIDEVLAGTPDRQFGPLMKQVMAKLGSGADGKVVSEILKQKLQ